jgi:hypothetical protein
MNVRNKSAIVFCRNQMPLSFLIIRLYILKLFSFLYIKKHGSGWVIKWNVRLYKCCWSLGISNHIFRMGQLLFFLEEICHTSLDVLWRASSPTQNDNNKRKMSRIVLFRAGNFCIIFSEYLSNCIYIFIDINCVLFRSVFYCDSNGRYCPPPPPTVTLQLV